MDEQLRRPPNTDGFETGDYRNFAPVYLGTRTDWIRPTATVTDENPIAGEHSLRWRADDDPHQWLLVNNAVHLATPIRATVAVRIDGPAAETCTSGIGLAETNARGALLRVTGSGIELTTETWDGEPAAWVDADLARGTVYDLSVSLAADGTVTATVAERASTNGVENTVIARLKAHATIEPNALALYVDTIAGGDATLTFDDVAVESGPYRVESDAWTRSPRFVVVPRAPDVPEDQGNWIGAASIVREDDGHRLWYRIRNAESRGAGYGLAESEDGLSWEKSSENPVLLPDHGQDSNEGLSVLEVDGEYRAWYTIDRDGTWHVAHARSADGIEWTQEGVVIEGYCKDPVVLLIDGTYYLYAIGPENTQVSVHTSADGREWTRQNTIDLGAHGHPGAYYVKESETVWLYVFAEENTASPSARVRRAGSTDGIHFEDLATTWQDPPVGIDHRPAGGIDYGTFPTDGHGHVRDDRRLLMYYQARHDYRNNRPDWRRAGDGVIALAGRFSGLFEGVPTTIDGERYAYHGFPVHATPIRNLAVAADRPTTITVDRWTPDESTLARGHVETDADTTLAVTLDGLDAEREYVVRLGEETASLTTTADGSGRVELRVERSSETDDRFEVALRS